MFKLTEGQTVKLNYDLEIESESGHIAIVEAGTPVKIKAICTTSPNQTPEQYFEEYGNYNVDIEALDIDVQDIWDRSGQSDFTVTASTNLDIEESDLQD